MIYFVLKRNDNGTKRNENNFDTHYQGYLFYISVKTMLQHCRHRMGKSQVKLMRSAGEWLSKLVYRFMCNTSKLLNIKEYIYK